MANLVLDPAFVVGLLLAITRAGAFIVACPMLAKPIPAPGRFALSIALGVFLAEPVATDVDLFGLMVLGTANAAVGLAAGMLSGILFNLFAAAGSLIDMSSGVSAAALFDPTQGEQAAIFSRLFNLVALALFYALDGVGALVRGLAGSVEAIPLDGTVDPQPSLSDITLDLSGRLLVLATELALPMLSALFLTELVLGLAGRLAPQANVFLLGMPLKLLLTFGIGAALFALFPQTVDAAVAAISETFRDTIRALMP